MFLLCRGMNERTASKSKFADKVHKSIHANSEAESNTKPIVTSMIQ